MKNYLIVLLLLFQFGQALAQHCCMNDTMIREIQFPMTERDTETVFCYFNNEWIGVSNDMVQADSIQKAEIKDDEYGNRAIFFTVSPEYLAQLKSKRREMFINFDPQCEFPGGNGKLKEWLDENIRIPEGYKGNERVHVGFMVMPNGTVTDVKMLRASKNDEVNAEALRLVNALPKFRVKYYTPKKMPIRMAVPISFRAAGGIWIR